MNHPKPYPPIPWFLPALSLALLNGCPGKFDTPPNSPDARQATPAPQEEETPPSQNTATGASEDLSSGSASAAGSAGSDGNNAKGQAMPSGSDGGSAYPPSGSSGLNAIVPVDTSGMRCEYRCSEDGLLEGQCQTFEDGSWRCLNGCEVQVPSCSSTLPPPNSGSPSFNGYGAGYQGGSTCQYPCSEDGLLEGQCRTFEEDGSWRCQNGCEVQVLSCD
jgi:hypothetical protein